MKRVWLSLIAMLLLGSLAGCATLSDPESSQENRSATAGISEPGKVVGQTLISRRPRLSSLQVWLSPVDPQNVSGVVAFDLYPALPSENEAGLEENSPHFSEEPVLSTAYSAESLAKAGTIVLQVPDHPAGAEQAYFLRIRSSTSPFAILGTTSEAYPAGEASSNGEKLAGDIAFRVSYAYQSSAVLADLTEILRRIWLALPLLLTLWLPGRILLVLTGTDAGWDWGERLALSLGLSLAFIPVLLLWTSLTGLNWSRTAVWVVTAVMLGAWFWKTWSSRSITKNTFRSGDQNHLESMITTLALIIIFSGAVYLRLAMVRDLAAPAWVDPVHHGLITRLIMEQGMLPYNYAPFLPEGVASYHSGFHAGAAVFLWLSGVDLAQGLLVYGQILNALMIFPVYLFTRRFTGSRPGGVIAALIVSFITPMPAYYTSWGRYTQLAALAILPAAVGLQQRLWTFDRNERRKAVPILFLGGLAGAGLFLTHYRVAAFFGVLLGIEVLTRSLAQLLRFIQPRLQDHSFHLTGFIQKQLAPDPLVEQNTSEADLAEAPGNFSARVLLFPPPESLTPRRAATWTAITGLLAILLSLPWWPAAIGEMVGPKMVWEPVSTRAFNDFAWTFLTAGLGRYSLALAGAGLLLALLLRRRFIWTLALWTASLFFLANLAATGLPGGGFINNTAVAISLFLPVAAVGGFGLGWLGQALSALLGGWLGKPGRLAPWLVYTGLAALAAVMGMRALLPILNPTTFLFRAADQPAMAWISANIPEGETVLVNSFNWGYGIFAGQDGGYWISPLAGRPTFPPPVLYGLDNDVARIQATSARAVRFNQAGSDPETLSALLDESGIQYIYIGARGGTLDPLSLESSSLFEVIYHQADTWVFKTR